LKFANNTPPAGERSRDRRRRRPDTHAAVEPERLSSLTLANKLQLLCMTRPVAAEVVERFVEKLIAGKA
jgi:hypothetical protein